MFFLVVFVVAVGVVLLVNVGVGVVFFLFNDSTTPCCEHIAHVERQNFSYNSKSYETVGIKVDARAGRFRYAFPHFPRTPTRQRRAGMNAAGTDGNGNPPFSQCRRKRTHPFQPPIPPPIRRWRRGVRIPRSVFVCRAANKSC